MAGRAATKNKKNGSAIFFDAEFREFRGKNAEENLNKLRVFPKDSTGSASVFTNETVVPSLFAY